MNLLHSPKILKSLVVIAFFSTLFMQSCSEYEYGIFDEYNVVSDLKSSSIIQTNEYRVLSKKYKLPKGSSKWEAQLDRIIEDNAILEKNKLTLNDYKCLRDVVDLEDVEKVKSILVSERFLFPVYNSNNEELIISKEEITKENYEHFLNMLIPTSENTLSSTMVNGRKSSVSDAVYFFKKNDLSIVELEWNYKDEIIYTTCLVSKERGIVYDKILYFIHAKTSKTEEVENMSTIIPRLKSTSVEGSGNLQYTFRKTDEAYNYYGIRVWYYNIQCTVTGTMVDSQKSITDKSMSAYHDAAFGFSCDAQIRSKSFTTGTSGHLDFAWGYCYNTVFTANLSWQGSGFSIGGGGTGETGEEYVSPNELN